jgi:hypothetical protein
MESLFSLKFGTTELKIDSDYQYQYTKFQIITLYW